MDWNKKISIRTLAKRSLISSIAQLNSSQRKIIDTIQT